MILLKWGWGGNTPALPYVAIDKLFGNVYGPRGKIGTFLDLCNVKGTTLH